MDFDSIKKILKSNQIKFLWAILASILIHLFLLGGIDLYNPFFLKNSDSLNIVIKSHLESSLKKEEIITKQKSSTPKKNRQINNNSKEKKDSSVKDLNQEIQNNEFNEISLSGEKKEIQYKKVVIDYDVRRSLDGSPVGAARTMYFLGENNQYSIKNEVEAKGFVSLFYWNKLVQTSDGIVTPEGLKPKNYHYQFGSKIDNYAIFDWESKKIITTISGKTSEFDMLEGSQDMLSFMYQDH